ALASVAYTTRFRSCLLRYLREPIRWTVEKSKRLAQPSPNRQTPSTSEFIGRLQETWTKPVRITRKRGGVTCPKTRTPHVRLRPGGRRRAIPSECVSDQSMTSSGRQTTFA